VLPCFVYSKAAISNGGFAAFIPQTLPQPTFLTTLRALALNQNNYKTTLG